MTWQEEDRRRHRWERLYNEMRPPPAWHRMTPARVPATLRRAPPEEHGLTWLLAISHERWRCDSALVALARSGERLLEGGGKQAHPK